MKDDINNGNETEEFKMTCNNCGSEVKGKFCANCGAQKLGETQNWNTPQTANTQYEKPKKKLYEKWWVWVIAVILFFVFIDMQSLRENQRLNVNDEIKMPSSSATFEGQDYEDVVYRLQHTGFTNIETKALGDLITGWLNTEGSVKKVTVNGDENYSTSSWYPKDVRIVVSYHSFPEEESEDILEEIETLVSDTTETSISDTKLKPEPTQSDSKVDGYLDLDAINNTNSAEADGQFIGKTYRVTGKVYEAMPADIKWNCNACVIIRTDVMAKGVYNRPLELCIWMTPGEFKKIGGMKSVGKQIDVSVKLTEISRSGSHVEEAYIGYPIDLQFGEPDLKK